MQKFLLTFRRLLTLLRNNDGDIVLNITKGPGVNSEHEFKKDGINLQSSVQRTTLICLLQLCEN